MHTIDWIFVFIPLALVLWSAVKAQKYVKGVADFLTAGRVAGRYVLSVASGEAGMGLISVVAVMEMYYNSGFAFSFWQTITAPIGLLMGLVGFCTYRFRETKAMTMGQFFEMRYSKSFRVTASVIQSLSGIVNYAIFPAVGARFILYFLDLPVRFNLMGWQCPTFGALMLFFLGLALLIALMGGQVTIMVTDCVQGMLSYPIYMIVVAYFIYRFSWSGELAPALMARAPGESFLNPFDVGGLRDFNLFYVFAGIVGMFLGRMSWGGTQGYNGAAKTPHESKMGALLGTWRSGFSGMMFLLLSIVAFTYLNHAHFADEARAVREELATKTLEDVAQGEALAAKRTALEAQYKAIPARQTFSESFASSEAYQAETSDPYLAATAAALVDTPAERQAAQTFRAIYAQMRVPVAIREILPVGITGLFLAIMIFLMISTDTTYMHSWGSIVVQDFIVPLRRRAFKPKDQINALRPSITGVAVFAFLFSYYFAQIDFILMFFSITGAIWAGAGVVITLGLYWKRGTTAGAFTALIVGAVIAVSGIVAQKLWASHLYPAIAQAGMVESVGAMLHNLSSPFHPYVVWEMDPLKFPITSIELAFIANMITVLLYVGISLLTCKTPFNMDRLLHRGIYRAKGEAAVAPPRLGFRAFFQRRILGIDHQYTRGDRILAWSVFLWSFGFGFVVCFIVPIVWNAVSPLDIRWWSAYFFLKNLVVAAIVGVISTVWFGICGMRDLFRLFRELDKKESDDLDDGRVIGHVSAEDLAEVAAAEQEAVVSAVDTLATEPDLDGDPSLENQTPPPKP